MGTGRNVLCAVLLTAVALGCAPENGGGAGRIEGTGGAAQTADTPDRPAVEAPAAPLVIDVRTKDEYDSGHLEGALNIPHDVIGPKIGAVTEDKDREIVLYCRSGRRAGVALDALKALGYTNVTNAGGDEALKQQQN